ncbi:MAG: tyrosine-type recombinase/integrase [Methyloceanibacter sp.]
MRVNLKGVASATKVLATGEKVTYYYAWRGGPQLRGFPGSPEFVQSYEQAHRERQRVDPRLFKAVIAGYLASPEFAVVRDRTKADYLRQLAKIERAFGNLPIAALDDPKVTKDFLDWRDGMASSARQADYAWTVLMLLLAWARSRGITSYRPPGRIKRLYHGDRSDKIWESHHVAAFMSVAPTCLQWALVLAAETGQRQGDLLKLTWSTFDGEWISLTQSKNGRKVRVPVTKRLHAVLGTIVRKSPTILTNSRNHPWAPNAFRKAWAAAATKAGIVGLHFHDLRGTAVTRLSEASCTPQEIARFTGHSLRDVAAILDKYLARTDKLASMALAKLERARK